MAQALRGRADIRLPMFRAAPGALGKYKNLSLPRIESLSVTQSIRLCGAAIDNGLIGS